LGSKKRLKKTSKNGSILAILEHAEKWAKTVAVGLFVFPLFGQNTFQHFGQKMDQKMELAKKSDFSTFFFGVDPIDQKSHFLTLFDKFIFDPKK